MGKRYTPLAQHITSLVHASSYYPNLTFTQHSNSSTLRSSSFCAARMATVTGIGMSSSDVSNGQTCILSTCTPLTKSESLGALSQRPELTIHRHHANVVSPRAAERAIEITSSLIDLARCDFSYDDWPERFETAAKTVHKPTICFDEWNIWDDKRAPGDKGAEELYDVSDMLAVAAWLNVFVRQAKRIGMATVAQSVNVISPLMTTPRGVVRQTTYWPLLLFSRFMRGKSLATHVCASVFNGPTFPGWLESTSELPLLDVSAALSDDGYVNLAVVNVAEEKPMSTTLSIPANVESVSVFTVGGKVNGIRDNNTEGSEKVYIRESKWNRQGPFTFEQHSFTLLRWKAAGMPVANGHSSNGTNGAEDLPNGIRGNSYANGD
jgi:hypothetical protein